MIVYLFLLAMLPSFLFAKPKNGQAVAGTVKIEHHGAQTSIRASDRAVIHWDEFSLGSKERAEFIQPSTNSAVLNRVHGGVSQIDGILQANGRVYLVNPRGVVIGKEGIVTTAGFVASTLDLENEDFFKNHPLLFTGKSDGAIVNLGKIEALGGDVILLARTIVNEGVLRAKEGVVALGAAEEILLKPSGEERLYIAPAKGEKGDGGIQNQGVIEATQAELKADGNVFRYAINQSGVIEANGTREKEGRVYLVAEGGSAIHSGSIHAMNADGKGGEVHLLGDHVGLLETGLINVSGALGGGQVLMGGDFQGKEGDIRNATMSVVMAGAEIFADALDSGDGGKVVLWSDEIAVMQGDIYARGGKEGGDGGFVEVSGIEHFDMSGYVNTSAPKGKKGDLLLDPSDIAVQAGPTTNMEFSSATGIFTADGFFATLATVGPFMPNLVDALETSSTNITISTSSSFGAPGSVIFNDPIEWTSDNDLIVQTRVNITLEAPISNTGAGSVIFSSSDGNISIRDNISLAQGSIEMNTIFGAILFEPVVNSVSVSSLTGNVTLNSGFEITLASPFIVAALNDVFVGPVRGSLFLNCQEDLSIFGPNANGTSTILSPGEGVSTLNVGGNVVVTGGSITDSLAVLGVLDAPLGETTINVVGDVLVTGGQGTQSPAILGVQGAASGVFKLNVGGNVRVIGGNTDSFAVIGGARGGAAGPVTTGGGVVFNAIGGNVDVLGGTSTGAFAHIGFVNGQTTEAGFFASGIVSMNDILGDVSIISISAPAGIGFGNILTLGADEYLGNVNVDSLLDIGITASSNIPAAIGFVLGGSLESVVQSDQVKVSGRNIDITAAHGADAFIGMHVSNVLTPANGSIGVVSVSARDDLTLNPATVNSFTFDGSAAIGTFAENGQARSNISVSGGDISLNTFAGANGAKSRILTSESSVTGAHEISIASENLFVTTAGEILAAGDLEMISNKTTFLSSGSVTTTNGGMLTIVVDNAFPKEPESGNGQFVLDGGATLTSNGGLLRIFTAKRSENSIESSINGVAFVAGPFLTNSSTEQWGEYFPNSFGGIPFTIFYKSAIPSDSFNENGRVISEMFQNLKTYDELLFSCKYFLLGYDKDCYDRHLHPKGMVSSFDLFHDEEVNMLRQKYRNYHLKYVDSF